jgi:glycosyltransferase involved in cell wall biosynthesis
MAKVDVVVPCYNYGRFLEACVESILLQSIKDIRVLIIDDASSDDSIVVAKKLARSDSRVSVTFHSQNQGHIETYNEGIAWASADYFLLLSADDLLVDGALQRATEVMDENPDIGLTYGECKLWFDHLPLPVISSEESYTWARHDLIAEMCATSKNLVPTPTAIARTQCQKAVGGYRESLPHTGDMEMWLRFAANCAVAKIDTIQAIYRRHSTAMSNPYFAERMSDLRQRQLAFNSFFDECANRISNSRSLRALARQTLAHHVFRSGVGLVRRGRFREGFDFIRGSIEMDPWLCYVPPFWHNEFRKLGHKSYPVST